MVEVQMGKDHIGDVARANVLSSQAIQELSAAELAQAAHHGTRSSADAGVNQDEPIARCTYKESAQRERQHAIGVQELSMWSPLLIRGALECRGRSLHDAVKHRLDDELANLHARTSAYGTLPDTVHGSQR